MKINIKKICILFFMSILLVLTIYTTTVNAVEATDVITYMGSANTAVSGGASSGIGKVINIIIGLLQIAGTGISVIVVTMLGIKYILASVEEKAEIKKQAVPIVIGCVLLFGAVNLMAAVEEFAASTINS